jgi:hypothetical protein
LAHGAGHVVCSLAPKARTRNEVVHVLRINTVTRAQDVELGRAESDAVSKAVRNSHLPVLHARRDLCEQHVTVTEICEALLYFGVWAVLRRVHATRAGLNSRHWYERDPKVLRNRPALRLRVELDRFRHRHGARHRWRVG